MIESFENALIAAGVDKLLETDPHVLAGIAYGAIHELFDGDPVRIGAYIDAVVKLK